MDVKVDVIIPTLMPGQEFADLLEALERQSVQPGRIIVMNTEEKYFERLKYGNQRMKKYSNVEVHHLSSREFDHGNTRNNGVKKSGAPYFVCMTMDALPKDAYLLERPLEPLVAGDAAVSYARQLPKPGCSPVESFIKQFNYPATSRLKGQEDLEEMGIKTFFCSNACAAYDRSTFDALGGFIRHTIFNEDMIYASRVVKAGKKIAYVAQAEVLHSHNYSWIENFHRNFDVGVSQADNPDVFRGIKSETEGIRLVKELTRHLKESGNSRLILPMLWGSGWKFLGYRLGKHYTRLPQGFVRRCSMNRNYWQ